jgi:hypothetical protein
MSNKKCYLSWVVNHDLIFFLIFHIEDIFFIDVSKNEIGRSISETIVDGFSEIVVVFDALVV